MSLTARLKRCGTARQLTPPPIPIRATLASTTPQAAVGCSCGGGCPACKSDNIAGPDHPAEREADAVAARVMSMSSGVQPVQRISDELPMRMPELEEQEESLQLQPDEEEEEEILQPRAEAGGARTPQSNPVVGLGGGKPLDTHLRQFFEPRFGRIFADVRIHNGTDAAERARSVNAQAFTYGRNIVFNRGRFSPESHAGRQLLAHELTHVVQQGKASQQVQRVPDMTDERRQFVQMTVEFLTESVTYFTNPQSTLDAATFNRLLNSWLRMVVRQERIIDNDLEGDADLKAELRAAYIAALRVVVPRMATTTGQSEADIYRVNSGRIPMWAWPSPHHLESGISTPIADTHSADPLTGDVGFSSNGFNVVIQPDGSDASLGSGGETNAGITAATPAAQTMTRGGRTTITRVDPTPVPVLTIQTVYGPTGSAGVRSAYGRGRTTEDLAGAGELPRSRTLGFHEGAHGLAFLEYVASHPAPTFTGSTDMTLAQFNAARAAYATAIADYQAAMIAFSLQVVDCVVTTTIDQHHQAEAAPGVDVVIRCVP